MLKIKLDENISPSLKSIFPPSLFFVSTIQEESMLGQNDYAVYVLCKSQKKVLITFDRGFEKERDYPKAETEGIIIIKTINQSPSNAGTLIKKYIDTLGEIKEDYFIGKKVRIEDNKVIEL